MRMTSPEKLILENQMQLMMAMSLLLAHAGEKLAAHNMSAQCSRLSVALQHAKTWPEGSE